MAEIGENQVGSVRLLYVHGVGKGGKKWLTCLVSAEEGFRLGQK